MIGVTLAERIRRDRRREVAVARRPVESRWVTCETVTRGMVIVTARDAAFELLVWQARLDHGLPVSDTYPAGWPGSVITRRMEVAA